MSDINLQLDEAIRRFVKASKDELGSLSDEHLTALEWTLERSRAAREARRCAMVKRVADSRLRALMGESIFSIPSSKTRNERVMEVIEAQAFEYETQCWLWKSDFGGTLFFNLWASEDAKPFENRTIYIVASPFDPSEVEPYDGERTLDDEKDDPAIWAPIETLLLNYLRLILQGWGGEPESHNKELMWFCKYIEDRVLKPAKALMLEPDE